MIDDSGTRHARSCLIIIAARERPRAGSKQMATYQAVAQTKSSWSSSCERTSPCCGRKHMTTYQAVAQTQSMLSVIAERERPRAGSKQMATYQAVVAQTQSSLVSRDGFGSPVPRQPPHPHTQAESGAYLRDSSRVPRRRPFIYFKPPYAIGSVPSLSGHAIAYRWRSLPRVRRHRASEPQGNPQAQNQ